MRRFPAVPGAGASLEKLARRIHRHTEGNALFVVTLLEDLIARGVLVCRDDRWSASPDLHWDSLGIPADIRGTIQHQIDRLDPIERRLLEVASVAGERFASATIAAGAALPVEDVEATLGVHARRSTAQSAEALTVLASLRNSVPEPREVPDVAEATALIGQASCDCGPQP